LDAEQAVAHAEDQVVSPSLAKRAIDLDAELDRSKRDRGFRDVALLVCRESHLDSLVV
jgi:hypothetical protein